MLAVEHGHRGPTVFSCGTCFDVFGPALLKMGHEQIKVSTVNWLYVPMFVLAAISLVALFFLA